MGRLTMTIRFLRNKVVEVEPLPDGDLAVSWRLTDDLLKAEVDLRVRPPDLEIVEAMAKLERLPLKQWSSAPQLIKKVEGVRIGAGLRKIVNGLLGGPERCSLLAHAVLEAANAVILHFTRPGLEAAEQLEGETLITATRAMVSSNPRLVRSCVAFQDDSPIMQGLDL
jgi:hypothetical protein